VPPNLTYTFLQPNAIGYATGAAASATARMWMTESAISEADLFPACDSHLDGLAEPFGCAYHRCQIAQHVDHLHISVGRRSG
jgi:hypothetical protein